ncbi:hypothetical protein [Lentzea fradiae]|nr:hypothetical protein [Lentzea fradiae]
MRRLALVLAETSVLALADENGTEDECARGEVHLSGARTQGIR